MSDEPTPPPTPDQYPDEKPEELQIPSVEESTDLTNTGSVFASIVEKAGRGLRRQDDEQPGAGREPIVISGQITLKDLQKRAVGSIVYIVIDFTQGTMVVGGSDPNETRKFLPSVSDTGSATIMLVGEGYQILGRESDPETNQKIVRFIESRIVRE